MALAEADGGIETIVAEVDQLGRRLDLDMEIRSRSLEDGSRGSSQVLASDCRTDRRSIVWRRRGRIASLSRAMTSIA
jgi:hypothetical protein